MNRLWSVAGALVDFLLARWAWTIKAYWRAPCTALALVWVGALAALLVGCSPGDLLISPGARWTALGLTVAPTLLAGLRLYDFQLNRLRDLLVSNSKREDFLFDDPARPYSLEPRQAACLMGLSTVGLALMGWYCSQTYARLNLLQGVVALSFAALASWRLRQLNGKRGSLLGSGMALVSWMAAGVALVPLLAMLPARPCGPGWLLPLGYFEVRTMELQKLQGAGLCLRGLHAGPGQTLDLSAAQLSGANLMQAKLAQAKLSAANLEGARLDYAEIGREPGEPGVLCLRGANLTGATVGRIHSADLSQVVASGAVFRQADLSNSSVADADLQGALGLEASLLKLARGNDGTQLPSELPLPPQGGKPKKLCVPCDCDWVSGREIPCTNQDTKRCASFKCSTLGSQECDLIYARR